MQKSQTAVEIEQLRTRLARLEKMFSDFVDRQGAVQQAAQIGSGNWGSNTGGVAVFRLTTSASAASGASYSSNGQGIIQYDNSGSFADVSGASAQTLCNYHTKGFTSGTAVFVDCVFMMNNWYIFDLNDCTKYV
jgi:hypothetical protein